MAVEIRNGKVLMSKDEYDHLIRTEFKLDQLMKLMYKSATLSWRKDEIRFDSDILTAYMKATDSIRYMDEYYRLMEEKEHEKADQ